MHGLNLGGILKRGLLWREKYEGSQVVSAKFWEYDRNVGASGPPKAVKF